MATKYPVAGNKGAAWRAGERRRRGIALVSVVAVLVLLLIVATPFLLSMRDSAKRGERYLYGSRAEAEAESLFEQVRGHLTSSVEHVERRALDALGPGGGAQGGMRAPAHATPTVDTPEEFRLPASFLAEFNQLSGKEHRVWDVDVRDAQALFNLNSCSFGVLANLLGRAELTAAIEPGDQRIPVSNAAAFPADGGVVRIGTEVVKYTRADPRSNTLEGCERGYMATRPECGNAAQHDEGKLVLPEAAVQIGMRPFRWRPGAWTRYTNVYEARSIAAMGVAALPAESFDRVRRHLTAYSGNAVGDGWSNPQLVRNGLTAGTRAGDLFVTIKNLRYFGPGTVVMITDGVNRDYGVVVDVRGTNDVELLCDLKFDYPADQTRIYSLARTPINLNTADVDALTHVFWGLKIRGKQTRVERKTAEALAVFLKEWVRPTDDAAAEKVRGVFTTWDDFVRALEEARDQRGLLNGDEFEAVLKNALNSNDSTLQFSTVPFVFRSYDVYEARATATLLGIQGQELARRELTRTFQVSTSRSATSVAESQADFQDQIRLSRDAKWMGTFPNNITSFYEGANVPPSEYLSYATRNRFPDTDRASGVGHVQLAPGAFRYTGRTDRFHHFDEQDTPDGLDLAAQPLALSIDGPYDVGAKKLGLVQFVAVPQRSGDTEIGLAPFACSFWYKPRWDQDSSEHVIFDYGFDEPFMNRVTLRYDPERRALVLAVCDATREQKACEVVAEIGGGQPSTFEKDRWYHVAAAVHGCSPEMMSLFVDAEQQGRAPLQTRLVTPISSTAQVQSIAVEDASGFPDSGVLILKADEGIELFEYSSRSDNAFQIRRRRARTIDEALDPNLVAVRNHPAGATVTLYGFAAPLLTDVKRGGGRTETAFGPFRAFRCHGTDVATLPYSSSGGGGGTILFAGIGRIDGYQPVVTLTEWDTGAADASVLDDLGPEGSEGIAMIASAVYTSASLVAAGATIPPQMQVQGGGQNGQNDSASIGGVDIVHYRVGQVSGTGVQVTLLSQGLTLRHYDAATWTSPANANGGRFFPTYDYGYTNGNPNAGYATLDNGSLPYQGAYTAFVPIALTTSAGGEYLDPADAEPQLGQTGAGTYVPGPAYVQVDGEWFKYDTFDTNTLPGKAAFYRDTRLDDLAQLWGFASITVDLNNPSQSAGQGGGGGQKSSNTEPQHAQDLNDPANAVPAPSGSTVNAAEQTPPVTTLQIAQNLDFRPWQDRDAGLIHSVANTLPADHAGGTEIIACFATVTGDDANTTVAGNGAAAGFDDLLTFRDLRGSDEQIRVQWGYRNWVGPTAATTQRWNWDRAQFPVDMRRWSSRAWTRIVKFPSGELPDASLTQGAEDFLFGKRFDDQGGASPAMIDELAFFDVKVPEDETRRDYALLGEVPAQLQAPSTGTPIRFTGIDENADEFPVFFQYWDDGNRLLVLNGLPIDADVFPEDGGLLRIDEELIFYSEFDPSNGRFSGCRRGCFGTEARAHRFGAVVAPVETFPMSRLAADADESSASFQLADNSDFPDDGYLRIADLGELIGYTQWEQNVLSGPLRRIDPKSQEATSREEDKGRRVGGALFRGRYATESAAYQVGDVVLAMPFRYYDRYADRSDDPENSYLQFSWTRRNAVWKRITWDDLPKKNVEVIAHVRFSGGPEWDADRIIRVGQQQMPGAADRRNWIYEIIDPKAENLLNVEADRCEVRMLIRFAKGAYDRFVTPASDDWKDTPEIRKVVVEYVSPSAVMSQE